jgi:hypothetical protein
MAKILALFVACLLMGSAAGAAGPRLDREKRELQVARTSILATLLTNKHPKGKYRCAQDQLACITASPAELGLALIGARVTKHSSDALSGLIAVQLDAGLGEDFMCYVLDRGKSFGQQVERLDPAKARAVCLADAKAVLARVGAPLAGVDASAVCRDEKEIANRKAEIASAIRAGSRCNKSDF